MLVHFFFLTIIKAFILSDSDVKIQLLQYSYFKKSKSRYIDAFKLFRLKHSHLNDFCLYSSLQRDGRKVIQPVQLAKSVLNLKLKVHICPPQKGNFKNTKTNNQSQTYAHAHTHTHTHKHTHTHTHTQRHSQYQKLMGLQF